MSLDDDARAELAALEAAGRLRTPRVVDGVQGRVITLDGREVLNLSSNDYLGLAGDPRLAVAGGGGAGASRLIAGNHRELVALESELGDWLGRTARVFNSGYACNVGVMSTLARAGDTVFSDELNHASIIDGCRLSRARVEVYPHLELAILDEKLRGVGGRKLVVSESLFSMDGDFADVFELAAVCRKHDAALILDEAHAVGALGPSGRGVAAEAGVVPDVLIGTFGKAFGTFGAFAATTPAIAALLWNRARSFVFSTGLPPVVAAQTRVALGIVRDGDELRRRLAANVARFGGKSAIVPFVVGDDRLAMRICDALLADGLYVQGIRPPTVPEGTARLRASLSAALTIEDVDRAARGIANALRLAR